MNQSEPLRTVAGVEDDTLRYLKEVTAELLLALVVGLDHVLAGEAAVLTGFSQFSPADGVPAADSTEVLVWYSPDAIHFGVRAFAPAT